MNCEWHVSCRKTTAEDFISGIWGSTMQEAGSAYIVAAVGDAPPRSLPHDQHVHLCLYRARGVQRLPAPICRFPVGVTDERMFEKFSIVILRTNMVMEVMVNFTLRFMKYWCPNIVCVTNKRDFHSCHRANLLRMNSMVYFLHLCCFST